MKTHALLCDIHPLLRHGLAQLLAAQPDVAVVAEADDVATAMEVLGSHPEIKLVITDLCLKRSCGLDLIRRVHADRPQVRTLVFASHDERIFARRALELGASAYVMHTATPDALMEAIRTVLAGGTWVSSRVPARARKTVGHAAPTHCLSAREFQVFTAIGNGASTKEIAGQLDVQTKTVDTLKARIKRKLSLADSHHLTWFAARWAVHGCDDAVAATPPPAPCVTVRGKPRSRGTASLGR